MSKLEFSSTPTRLRIMYESGRGVYEIMDLTGLDYPEVISRLREAGTRLITGGPHDTSKCHHRHWEFGTGHTAA